jgi:hypothetical protein
MDLESSPNSLVLPISSVLTDYIFRNTDFGLYCKKHRHFYSENRYKYVDPFHTSYSGFIYRPDISLCFPHSFVKIYRIDSSFT